MSRINKKSLEILKEALPVDGVQRIKERLDKYTIDYINKILNGTRQNDAVIETAIAIAKEEKDKKNALKNEIAELASI